LTKVPFVQLIVFALICGIALPATTAYAQGGGQRSGGLFGATRSDTDRNRLTALVEVSEGYDTEVPPEFQGQVPNTGLQSGGYSTLVTTAAEYLKSSRRLQVGGTYQSAFRYYQQLGEVATPSHSAGLEARVRWARTATLQVNQSAAYSPSYLFGVFPDAQLPGLAAPIAADPEYRVRESESYSYGTNVTFGLGSTRGSRLTASGDFGRTEFRHQVSEQPVTESYGGRVGYSRGFGRSTAISFEYEYRASELGSAPFAEHSLNIGGEYSRALSGSRRATFRFSAIPSTIEIPESAQGATVTGQVFRLQGEGAVDYQFRRTWRASGSYRRGVEYVPVLIEPIFADAARADLSGLLARRVDLSLSAGFAAGESALSGAADQLDTYTGTARVRFALTRALALYTEYFYYFYDLHGSTQLAPELPNTFEQHGIRAGLTLWVAVF
jgi:hypothetical protein